MKPHMIRTRKIFFIGFLSLAVFASFGSQAFAAGIDPKYRPDNTPTITENPQDETNVNVEQARAKLTFRIVNAVLGIAGVVAIFFIINNAWFMIISAGKEEAVTQRKKGLTWALVGLLFIILSYSIIRFIIQIPFQAQEEPKQETQQSQNSAAR